MLDSRFALAWFVVAMGLLAGRIAAQTDSDLPLRQRISDLSRSQPDDARFRSQVERWVALEGEGGETSDSSEEPSHLWLLFGFGAQGLFMLRFVVQWIASERKKRSVVPVAFWWLSLAGGLSLLVYSIHRRDPVFMFGQGLGCAIYIRNLVLIHRQQDQDVPSAGTAT